MLAIGGIVAAGWPARDKASVDLPWTPLTQASLAESQASGKTVVVEFTAEWCLNCKTVEKVTFGDGRVREALQSQEVILLKGDHTSRNPFSEQLLKEWSGQTGIPFTVVIREGRKELLPGIYGPGDLLKALGRE
jgi:thiol:disulfide interchange protein DsbD